MFEETVSPPGFKELLEEQEVVERFPGRGQRAQGRRCAAIGGEEEGREKKPPSDCRGEGLWMSGRDCPRRSCEDSKMRRPMRICALRGHASVIKKRKCKYSAREIIVPSTPPPPPLLTCCDASET